MPWVSITTLKLSFMIDRAFSAHPEHGGLSVCLAIKSKPPAEPPWMDPDLLDPIGFLTSASQRQIVSRLVGLYFVSCGVMSAKLSIRTVDPSVNLSLQFLFRSHLCQESSPLLVQWSLQGRCHGRWHACMAGSRLATRVCRSPRRGNFHCNSGRTINASSAFKIHRQAWQ